MQSLEWHGQSPLAKWFAITSTMIVALLAVLAGAMLLGAIRVNAYYDIAAPSSFEWLRPYGLTTVILAWVLHMASMLLLMGFVHTESRIIASLIMTGVAALYLLFVAASSLAALPMCGMKSMM